MAVKGAYMRAVYRETCRAHEIREHPIGVAHPGSGTAGAAFPPMEEVEDDEEDERTRNRRNRGQARELGGHGEGMRGTPSLPVSSVSGAARRRSSARVMKK